MRNLIRLNKDLIIVFMLCATVCIVTIPRCGTDALGKDSAAVGAMNLLSLLGAAIAVFKSGRKQKTNKKKG